MKFRVSVYIESGFPDSIRGVCHYEKPKDEYQIFLSDTLTEEQRKRTLAHEMFHVLHNDLVVGGDISEIEKRAHSFVDALYGKREGD